MATKVETFDAISLKNLNLQFHGNEEDTQLIGCIGSLSGETTLRELVKRCAGVEVRKRSKPESMQLTFSGHVRVDVLRKIFGLSNEGLKEGVYSYSSDAKGEEFTLTGDVIDEFEERTKLIAFPQCNSATGLQFTIENGADEVAEVELSFSVYPDSNNKFYYEAITEELDEVDAAAIIEGWHTDFNYELVESIATP